MGVFVNNLDQQPGVKLVRRFELLLDQQRFFLVSLSALRFEIQQFAPVFDEPISEEEICYEARAVLRGVCDLDWLYYKQAKVSFDRGEVQDLLEVGRGCDFSELCLI